MSMKVFYGAGAIAAALAVAGAVTVFADTPAAKPQVVPAKPPAQTAAATKPLAARAEHRMVRIETPAFGDIDTNHDGAISPAEFDAFHAAHKPGGREAGLGGPPEGRGPGEWGPPMRGERFGGHFGGGGRGGEGPGMEGLRGERALDLLDTNGDGKLSFDELTAPLKRHFERMDVNHDGVLSADEMKKGREMLEQQGPPRPPAQ